KQTSDVKEKRVYFGDGRMIKKHILEKIQPTLSGSQPGAALRVDIYRAIVFETTIANRGISYERTVPNAAQSSRTSDPEVSFAIFEQNVDPAVPAKLILFGERNPFRVDA